MPDGAALRFAILASGRGSNAQSLMKAFGGGFLPATLAVVVSNVPNAGVLGRAHEYGVPTETLPSTNVARAAHEADLLALLARHRVNHVLLAGYMRMLGPTFLQGFGGTILNIHPSLLPEFPGLHAAKRQWQAGRKVAGATVHQVDAGMDTGPVLLQGSLVVRGDEGADGLADRLLTEVEHVIYPRAVRLFLDRITNHG